MNHISTVRITLLLSLSLLVQACGGGASNEISDGARNIGPTVTNTSPSTINEREEATLSVEASDSDGTIREIRWFQLTGPSVSFTDGAETITFTVPEVTEDTLLSFSVDVVDNFGAISSADVEVTIININRAPVADAAAINVNFNDSVLFNLSASDPDDDMLMYSITQQPSFGTLTLEDEATQQYRYTPDTDSEAADSIEFTVSDGELSDSATINFTVITTKQAPLKITAISAPKTLFDPYWFEVTNLSDKAVDLSNFQLKSPGFDVNAQITGEYTANLSQFMLPAEQTVRVYLTVLDIPYLTQDGSGIAANASNIAMSPVWHKNGFVELANLKDQTVDMIHYGENERLSQAGYFFSSSRLETTPTATEWFLFQIEHTYFWLNNQ